MKDIKELSSSDFFFYYDTIPVDEQNEHELVSMLLQPKRTMFYNRSFGVGLNESENAPNAIVQYIGLRYEIVQGVSVRNTKVVEGSNGQKDRRMAVGQETVKVEQKNGDIDLTVYYINIYNYEKPNVLTLPVGTR